jgi:N-dimethylarginine dimethylaminohydrolase
MSGSFSISAQPDSCALQIAAEVRQARKAGSPSADGRNYLADQTAGLRAHSHDEFSQLREVVVGTATGARLPNLDDRSAWLNLYPDLTYDQLADVATGGFAQQVVDETNEDLEALVALFESLGIRVHRPVPMDHSSVFSTPLWQSGGFYNYCPRDLALIVGTTIIETPSPMRARYHELDALRWLFQLCLDGGSAWISAPKPRLADDLFHLDLDGHPVLGETEPAFEAANVLRCGTDLFYLVSGSGNEAGLHWLRSVLELAGGYRVHAVRDVYTGTHIDTTICLLRPGLVLLNPEHVTEATIPDPLRAWDRIWCPPMRSRALPSRYPLVSKWIGMNFLMIAPDLAVVDPLQTDLIAALEQHGIQVMPHSLRHTRVLGGGHHCVTLDTVRDAPLTNYFD